MGILGSLRGVRKDYQEISRVLQAFGGSSTRREWIAKRVKATRSTVSTADNAACRRKQTFAGEVRTECGADRPSGNRSY